MGDGQAAELVASWYLLLVICVWCVVGRGQRREPSLFNQRLWSFLQERLTLMWGTEEMYHYM